MACQLYVPADVDPDRVDQRIVEAAIQLPEYGAVTGWADLSWRGGRWFDGTSHGGREQRPVTLAIAGGNLRPTDRMVPSKERLRPADIEVVDGLRVTTAVRSVLFEMRYAASIRVAVRVADMAASDNLVSLDELAGYTDTYLNGWTGVPQARHALMLATENSWSPTEVEMRLVWTLDAELPMPLCNQPLFDLAGRHLATPDLLDPVVGVVGEYDGAQHHSGARRGVDLDRDELLRSVGLEVVTMVASDLAQPRAFLSRLRTTYARALARGDGPRRWTIDAPPWWIRTVTVARRRALSREDQQRLWKPAA